MNFKTIIQIILCCPFIAAANLTTTVTDASWESFKQREEVNLMGFMVNNKVTINKDFINIDSCKEQTPQITAKINEGYHSLALHRAAMLCHIALGEEALANQHQQQLLNLAQLIWDEQNKHNAEHPMWISDVYSSYTLLELLGYDVVDGAIAINKNKAILSVYALKDENFQQPFYFDVSHFVKKYDTYQSQRPDVDSINQQVFSEQLAHFPAIIPMAMDGMSEAMITVGNLMIQHLNKFPGYYPDAMSMFEQAATDGSPIAQYAYANRVFTDLNEKEYPKAHDFLNEAMQAKLINAFVLAIIVRENERGISKDQDTIDALLSVTQIKGKKNGLLEHQIFTIFANKNGSWYDEEKANHYLKLAVKQDYVPALISHGVREGKHSKSVNPHYEKAVELAEEPLDYLRLGLVYLMGSNTLQDSDKGMELLLKAGDSGSAASNNFLGLVYEDKKMGFFDLNKAFEAHKKAGNLGDKESEYTAANYLIKGIGTDKDTEKGLSMMEKLAKEGSDEAALYLGALYQQGIYVEQDHELAKKYYNRNTKFWHKTQLNQLFFDTPGYKPATESDDYTEWLLSHVENNKYARFQYIYLLLHEQPILENAYHKKWLKKQGKEGMHQAYYFLAELQKNKKSDRTVMSLYKKAHDKGNLDATFELAKLMKKNKKDGWLQLLNKAAQDNHIGAIIQLGKHHNDKSSPEFNQAKAIAYYQKAYDLGAHTVALDLTNLYLDDAKTESVEAAVKTLETMAKDTNYSRPIRNLGEIFSNNNFAGFDIQSSIKYFIQAASQGDDYSQIQLGKIFLWGKDMPQNFDLARFFFSNAAEHNEQEALFWLGLMHEHGWGFDQSAELAITFYDEAEGIYQSTAIKNNRSLLICQNSSDKKLIKSALKEMKTLSKSSQTAAFNLGWMYQHGLCTKASIQKAQKQYQIAAEMGSPYAQQWLADWIKSNPEAKTSLNHETLLQQAKNGFKKLKSNAVLTVLMPVPNS
ncbi:SEL1-like repeat protein [Marinicella rhabdoformis]|uniref:SEL1-like repeat protein n=1 Tax=Marinicella rhabdoformis TaxID=2580566 RepID=UPI0012AEC9E0